MSAEPDGVCQQSIQLLLSSQILLHQNQVSQSDWNRAQRKHPIVVNGGPGSLCSSLLSGVPLFLASSPTYDTFDRVEGADGPVGSS